MNLLEHYIKKVISVEPYPIDTTIEDKHIVFKDALKAMLLTNCYGIEEVKEEVFINQAELDKALEQGYILR